MNNKEIEVTLPNRYTVEPKYADGDFPLESLPISKRGMMYDEVS